MANTLRYTVLPVGQGTGTLVQVLNATGTPIETTLIDLGSLGWSTEAGIPSADVVIEQLKLMAEPKLDVVFLSHSDSDHNNLIGRVLAAFYEPSAGRPRKETLYVSHVWYGGANASYFKRNVDVLDQLEKYGANVHSTNAAESSWDLTPPAPLHSSASGVKYWLLLGNVVSTDAFMGAAPSRKGSRGYLLNVVSAVLIVEYGTSTQQGIVATGDATGLTLGGCMSVINDNSVKFPPMLSMSLPHHGSATTTYDLLGRRTDTLDEDALATQVVQELVKKLSPLSITASAGEHGTYHHPASRVIKDFGALVGSGLYRDKGLPTEHFFTAYYPQDSLALDGSMITRKWPPSTSWYTGRTAHNVFTIDYFRGNPATLDVPEVFPPDASIGGPGSPYADKPPRAAGWAYEVSEDGNSVVLKRVVDLYFATAQARAAIEAAHGPLPPRRFVFVPSAPPPDPKEQPAPARPAALVAAAPAPARRPPSSPGLRRMRQLP